MRESSLLRWGVVSPVLLNVALHDLEEAAGVRYRVTAADGHGRDNSPVLVCCFSGKQASGVREQLAGWLAGRGLSFNRKRPASCP